MGAGPFCRASLAAWAALRDPSRQLSGPAAESERLVSAYTGLTAESLPAAEAVGRPEWIDAAEASRLADVPISVVLRAVAEGELSGNRQHPSRRGLWSVRTVDAEAWARSASERSAADGRAAAACAGAALCWRWAVRGAGRGAAIGRGGQSGVDAAILARA